MTEATEKQIKYASSLGIENPSQYSKEALKEIINSKLGGNSGNSGNGGQNRPIAQKQPPAPAQKPSESNVVLNMKDKPHSYEFGKSGDRHKIYYKTIEELKTHMKALKDNGFITEDDNIDKF